ncbi:hypothetical protein L798_05763 [Zootermopsis nevadensis]|uniref:Uncharacterized protein n=1 Tax=Zootermopsis nevadensis TaxID=136037 RepID=A0A067RHC2_ZOONE|nr:hypothetical protein L798_05763 [Zootermopsis nevadensis]
MFRLLDSSGGHDTVTNAGCELAHCPSIHGIEAVPAKLYPATHRYSRIVYSGAIVSGTWRQKGDVSVSLQLRIL